MPSTVSSSSKGKLGLEKERGAREKKIWREMNRNFSLAEIVEAIVVELSAPESKGGLALSIYY